MRTWRMPSAAEEVDRLDSALLMGSSEQLPRRLRELAEVALELATALRAHQLAPEDRRRIGELSTGRAGRGRAARMLRRGATPRAVVLAAAGSGAALGLTVLGIALLRRAHLVARPV